MVEENNWWESDFVQGATNAANQFNQFVAGLPVIGGIVTGLQKGGEAVNQGNWGEAGRQYGSALGNMALAAVPLGRGVNVARGVAGAARTGSALPRAFTARGPVGKAFQALDPATIGRSIAIGAQRAGVTNPAALASAAGGATAGVWAKELLGVNKAINELYPSPTPPSTQSYWERDMSKLQGPERPVGQPSFPNDPFLQWQPGMTSSFSAEGIQQAGQAVQQAQQDANRFSQALGLTPAQTEQFQRALNQAELDRDRILGNLASQERQNRRITQQAARGTRARGAGSMADLQQAAAARGLMASPASYDVGRGQIGANVAAEQAQQQAALADFLSQVEAARGQTTSDYRQRLDEIARQRLAAEMQNEQDAINRLLSRFQ